MAAALLVRVVFALRFSVMNYGDGYARLVEPRQLVKSVWLPGYQATLAGLSFFTFDPDAFRWFTMAQGALAAAAGAWLGLRWFGPIPGWMAGITVACLPTFVLSSTALYQESLFIALSCSAVVALPSRPKVAGLLLCLACLTRYEGWLLAGFCSTWALWQRRYAFAAAAFAGPVGWVVVNRAISPIGTSSIDLGFSAGRVLDRVATMVNLLAEQGGAGVAILGGLGLLAGGRKALVLASFGAVHLLFLAVADPYSGAAHPRQLHIPLVLLGLLAGVGVQWIGAAVDAGRWVRRAWVHALPASAVVVIVGASLPAWKVVFENYPGRTEEIAAAVGRHLAADVAGGATVLVLAEGFFEYPAAETDECLAVRAWCRDREHRVVCDGETDPTGRSGVAPDVDAVVQIGVFRPWRALHSLAAGVGESPWTDLRLRDDLQAWTGDAQLASSLRSAAAALRPAADACRSKFAPGDRPADWQLTGTAVVAEENRLAFYTNGTASWSAQASGALRIWACGAPAGGRFPRAEVTVNGAQYVLETGPAYRIFPLGMVSAGDMVVLSYGDDLVAGDGGDRNLFVGAVDGSGGGPVGQ